MSITQRCLVMLCLGLALLRPAGAMMVAVPESQLLGSSELVIAGTVVQDARVDRDGGYLDGKAIIKVDEVLAGTAAGTVTVWHIKPPFMPPGVVIMDHGGFDLEAGRRSIFFLSRYRTDYMLEYGFQGMRDLDQLARIRQALAAFPYQLRMTAPAAFYFGQETPVTITVVNRGAAPVKVTHLRLDGQFYAPRMGAQFVLNIKNFEPGELPFPATIPVNGEQTFTIPYTMGMPQSWQLFSPDTYLLTPVTVRATAMLEGEGLGEGRQPFSQIASPWADTLTGFAPPKRD